MTTRTKTHIGDLEIRTSLDAAKYSDLVEVTGNLSIHSSVKLDAPVLTNVGGNLYINSYAKLDAPSLTSVGGRLYINSSVKLDALTSVGGHLYINSSVKLDALSLFPKGFDAFNVLDGIPCVVVSTKKNG